MGDDDGVVGGVGGHQDVDGVAAQAGDDVGAEQFRAPVAAQVPGHRLRPGEGVEGRPGLDLEVHAAQPQEGELQPQPLLVGGDVGVDAVGVSLQDFQGILV